MQKKILQDIVKKENNKKQNEFLTNLDVVTSKKKEAVVNEEILFSKFNNEIKSYKKDTDDKKQQNIWFVVFVCMIFLFFAVFSLFSKATIYVKPKTAEFSLNQKISLERKNAQNVGFVLVSISGEEEKNIDFGKREYIEKKASGKVVIFNEGDKQEIISSGTELVGLNDKKYFTKERVVVPKSTKVGEERVSGFVDVEIEAEDFGQDYNYNQNNFVISKFEDTDKEKLFSVLGSGVSGGIKGDVLLMDEEQNSKIILELKDKLKNDLISKIKDQIPEDSILFEDSIVFKEMSEESVLSEDGDFFNIKVKGTTYGILFSRENIIKKIAESVLEEDEIKNMVKVKDLDSFEFSFAKNVSEIDFENLDTIEFFLSGKVSFAWVVNEKEVMDSLYGINKKIIEEELADFKSIESTRISIRPFWLKNIPENPKKIELVVDYPF